MSQLDASKGRPNVSRVPLDFLLIAATGLELFLYLFAFPPYSAREITSSTAPLVMVPVVCALVSLWPAFRWFQRPGTTRRERQIWAVFAVLGLRGWPLSVLPFLAAGYSDMRQHYEMTSP